LVTYAAGAFSPVAFGTAKDPDATVDFVFDWSDWLSAGESIDSVAFAITPVGLTTVTSGNTATTATIWFSGGTAGTDYEITCTVTTDASPNARIDDRTAVLRVRER